MDYLQKLFFIWQREGPISLLSRILDKAIESVKTKLILIRYIIDFNYTNKKHPEQLISNQFLWNSFFESNKLDKNSRHKLRKYTILIIDFYVPMYDRESGSCRIFNIVKILIDLGHNIIFLPDDGQAREPYTSELESLNVEVLYRTSQKYNLKKQLKSKLSLIDIAWVCRPEIYKKYANLLRLNPDIKLAYDTVDLHFVRLKRQWELFSNHNKFLQKTWQYTQALEVNLAQSSDITIVVTEVEQNILKSLSVNNTWIVPNVHQPYLKSVNTFAERDSLLFIGSYNHPPNVDAVIWLCQEIMPLVWKYNPEIRLILLGNNPSSRIKALADDRVTVPGYIKDVESYFLNSRVFVAPLRFGAGMKGKIGQSLSYSLPIVTTSIGAEGMGLTDGFDVMIADEVQTFSQCILALYNDSYIWNFISKNANETISKYSPKAVQSQLSNMINSLF